MINQRKVEWFDSLKKFEYVMIFGAAQGAKETCQYVKDAGEDIECYIVSSRKDNPFYIEDKQVKVFDEISEKMKNEGLVIISQIYENSDNMKKILYKAGFKNVIPSASQMMPKMTEELWQQYCEPVLKTKYQESRLPLGKNKETICNKKICVYAVTSQGNLHKTIKLYNSNFIKYIQAGAKLADCKMCEITDDVGDNISELNPWYCELTAGYWIYKNDHFHDYVGLYHYSRGLDMTDEQIISIVQNNIDVVLPVPMVARHEVITRGMREGASIVFEAINRISPEYLEAAEKYFYGKMFFAGNLVLAKREIFSQYYEWMFKIINKCIELLGGGISRFKGLGIFWRAFDEYFFYPSYV